MSISHEFTATARQGNGRRHASRLRAAGKLPANVYGRGEKPLSVEIDTRAVNLLYQRTIGRNTLLTMKLEGQTDQTVMFKEVQRDPVKGKFLHVDFYHVDPAHSLKLRIPVVLEGVAKGVREGGGILNHTTRFLRVRCLPKDIPADVKVDVSELGLEESLLLQDVTPPTGVLFLDGKHTVLAHVSEVEEEKAPEVAAAGAVAAAGTPEVINEKKDGEAVPAAGAAAPAAAGGGKAAPAKAVPAKGAPVKGAAAASAAPAGKSKK